MHTNSETFALAGSSGQLDALFDEIIGDITGAVENGDMFAQLVLLLEERNIDLFSTGIDGEDSVFPTTYEAVDNTILNGRSRWGVGYGGDIIYRITHCTSQFPP